MRLQPTLALLFCLGVSAAGQLTYTTNSDGTLSVSAFAGSNAVQIPSSVNGRNVTSIADLAFAESAATDISIPSTVNSIGSEAFLFSVNLTNITVNPSNGVYASAGSVLFNRALTTLAAFPAGTGGSYTIPSSVKSVGPYAFAGGQLTNITIPTNVTSLGQQAFWSCSDLGTITIPGSITSFGVYAFWGCLNLSNVVIASGVRTIGANAFLQCSFLQTVTLPTTLTSIGANAFQSCGSLGEVIIPSGVTSIGSSAFAGCSSLTALFFLGNAPAVGSSAFGGDAAAAAYYLPGATGWSSFTAIPAAPWNAIVQTHDANFGVHNGVFGFDVTGSTNIPVVVEASVSPASGWSAVTNGSLAGGALHVLDFAWTNYPARFYRVRSP